MIQIPSLLRLAEHKALKRVSFSGSVVDLGGDANSNYLSFVSGTYTVTRVNFDPKTKPDIFHDLEQPLPIESNTYDGVVLFNVLEHIYNYEQLLKESIRILRPGGTLLLIVPFLFPLHPSPYDFRRFSGVALYKELESAGLRSIRVDSLGSGVWSSCYLLIDRLMPYPLRLLNFYSLRFLVVTLDLITTLVAKYTGRKYNPSDYSLGFCATAKKP